MGSVNQVANLGEGAQLVNPGIGPYGAGHMLMSKKTWDGLPADIQKIFNDFRFKWTNAAIQERYADFGVMMKTVEEQGLDYLEFTKEQSAQLFGILQGQRVHLGFRPEHMQLADAARPPKGNISIITIITTPYYINKCFLFEN